MHSDLLGLPVAEAAGKRESSEPPQNTMRSPKGSGLSVNGNVQEEARERLTSIEVGACVTVAPPHCGGLSSCLLRHPSSSVSVSCGKGHLPR